jgi:hypothetical protein
VIPVGDFQLLRDWSIYRLASSGSCVIPVGDFKPQRDFRVSRLPIHDPPDTQAHEDRSAAESPNKIG